MAAATAAAAAAPHRSLEVRYDGGGACVHAICQLPPTGINTTAITTIIGTE